MERAIRKVWQIIRKQNEEKEVTDEEIPRPIERLNNTHCRAVKTTPNKAWTDGCQTSETYKKEFKPHHRDTFEIGDEVFVSELETKNVSKLGSKFKNPTKKVKKFPKDTYLIRCNNKLIKRNHANIIKRKIKNAPGNDPVERRDHGAEHENATGRD